MVVSTARDWLGTIGTLAAVVLALFLQLWLPFLRRPKLRVEPFDRRKTSGDWTPDNPDGLNGVWFNMRVHNQGRRDSALNAEVILADAELVGWERASTSDDVPRCDVPLRPFKWSHARDNRADIPAGVTRKIHIGTVRARAEEPMQFEVEVFPALRNSLRNRLAPGRYRFSVAVVASNARARYYSLELDFREPRGTTHDELLESVRLELDERSSNRRRFI
jgi:hypothetical protein